MAGARRPAWRLGKCPTAHLAAGVRCIPTLFEAEPVQASEPEPLPGADGRHGLRIRVAAPSAEQAARHGAHHLMRWAFMAPRGLPVRHLQALLGRMRATPMGYTAGDGKGLLHLRVLWRAGADAPAECVYSSLDETERSFS